jgi:diaminopimelate epimerase
MGIKFTKMHGLGNDFMVIDAVNQSIKLSQNQIAALSNRYTGIGFDQCLIIEPSLSPDIDFNYRIFNADGQEVGQCGNGARCLALFAQYYGLTQKKSLKVATKTTLMQLNINADGSVTVDMGIPKGTPTDIPFIATQQATHYELNLDKGLTVTIHTINVGNPHAVLLVDDINEVPVHELGPQISRHDRFPEQTNTGFMQILNQTHIKLRVFERGSGETKACGSGAVAAAAIGQLYYNMADRIRVSLTGGDLIIDWPNKEQSIRLTGPASFVYEGTLFA